MDNSMETADTLMKIKGVEKLQSDSYNWKKNLVQKTERSIKKTADDFSMPNVSKTCFNERKEDIYLPRAICYNNFHVSNPRKGVHMTISSKEYLSL